MQRTLIFSLLLSLVASGANKPNFIIIFTDDQGYGDLGCFGSTTIKTPHLDRLAKEGRRFTSFMVASPVCSPSRTALLTGCYPKRVNMHQGVLFPTSKHGLNPAEHTIADHLKGEGYATACFGKWHLGHHPETLPTSNGFDTYLGIPYSNDMNHPENRGKPKGGPDGMDLLWKDPKSTLTQWQTPLMQDEKIIELPVDQRTVTRRYTNKSLEFIKANKENPFFLYLPHSMPHIPLYVPDEIRDPNPKNAYINVIEHIDSQVGRIIDLLRDLKLDQTTYLIFTTDNGPWLPFKHHGGSAGPLRDGKGSTFEGGQRVPCIMWAPGRIPANTTCNSLCGTIDLLPTIASLTKSDIPTDKKIDGVDITPLLTGSGTSPRNEFLYYASNGNLEGIRHNNHKLLVKKGRRPKTATNDQPAPKANVMLFDLKADLGEQNNLAEKHPEIVAKLTARMNELDAEITANQRPHWRKD